MAPVRVRVRNTHVCSCSIGGGYGGGIVAKGRIPLDVIPQHGLKDIRHTGVAPWTCPRSQQRSTLVAFVLLASRE
ncbi:hypothetical protein V8C43DRAFT_194158 [Trichoderma afarasin]